MLYPVSQQPAKTRAPSAGMQLALSCPLALIAGSRAFQGLRRMGREEASLSLRAPGPFRQAWLESALVIVTFHQAASGWAQGLEVLGYCSLFIFCLVSARIVVSSWKGYSGN